MKPINKLLKSIACLLALALVLTLLPPAAIAVGTETQEDTGVAKLESGETTTYYADLEEALLAAQSGDTVTLLKDCATDYSADDMKNESEYGAGAPTVKADVTVIIPAGITWTANRSATSGNPASLLVYGNLENSGSLRAFCVYLYGALLNEGAITITNDFWHIDLYNNGLLTNKGTINGPIYVDDSGSVAVNSGTVTGKVTAYAGRFFNLSSGSVDGVVRLSTDTALVVNAGTFSGEEVELYKGTFINKAGASVSGTVTMSNTTSTLIHASNLVSDNIVNKKGGTICTNMNLTQPCDTCGFQCPVTTDHIFDENSTCYICDGPLGDADGDGFVDAYDASLIKKYSVGAITASDLALSALDLDGDGYVDAYDASLIQKYSVGAIDKFPREE